VSEVRAPFRIDARMLWRPDTRPHPPARSGLPGRRKSEPGRPLLEVRFSLPHEPRRYAHRTYLDTFMAKMDAAWYI
jgi:hypothetical protein